MIKFGDFDEVSEAEFGPRGATTVVHEGQTL
jgi:hypothetical protein